MVVQTDTAQYQTLLADITDIYEKATKEIHKTTNEIQCRAYWQIGRKIVTEEQGNESRAGYGERLIERLSGDLTSRFGKGFSTTNLRYMRQYYLSFPIRQTSGELPWSTYQVLSTVKDKDARETMHEKALENNWSVRDLKSNLRKQGLTTVEMEEPYISPSPDEPDVRPLKISRGRLNAYKIKMCPVEDKGGMVPLIDCGFTVMREMPPGSIEKGHDGLIVEWKDGKLFEADVGEKEIYTFKATLERVIDGDTLLCVIDCGFGTWVRQRLRLRGINAQELTTQKGQLAAQHLERELKPCPFIIVKTHKADKYDRYLADIFYSGREKDPLKVAESGEYLNQQLIDKGLARRVSF